MTNSGTHNTTWTEGSQVGLWVTADRRIRHELRADGTYVEARGQREAAYTGRYWMEGTHIEYLDDTGFTADGDFVDGVLYHAGMVLTKDD
ncbi:putative ligand-binding protein with streptavidin-like fold [Diaminobutyricimonas aerilata]|uniref:Putative ligand-binding protein with streptavidin-like fold n=1 Tax=Diaminobutyricimonas aerilata TaxID=1162967 RepID=A0A2M9CM22_9MICO|nr:Atu4866 domain-containing protein [Diaminobutyricimonas aerilata]PJJ72957.1 putative ligand-binding protein with streptavidin-like fold [Diaminobutyricimonas aerilata]